MTPTQIKQRQEEEKRRQQAWDAAHPVEALKRAYEKAKAELDAENRNIKTLQSGLDTLKKSPEGLTLDSPERHHYSQKFAGTFGPGTFDVATREDLNILLWEEGNKTIVLLIMGRGNWFAGIIDVWLATDILGYWLANEKLQA